MKKNELGFRTEKKEKFKQIFPVITDKDLFYREGKEKEMIEMLGYKLGLSYETVELGRVEINGTVSEENMHLFNVALKDAGLEIMFNNKTLLIAKIKKVIYQLIYMSDDQPKKNISEYISKEVNHDYVYLSFLFSNIVGINIEYLYE